jgi:alkyl hydroperoxide reductase subunit AhpC
MLTIGDRFPEYELTALVPGDLSSLGAEQPEDYFTTVTPDTYPGKWRVVFFWPKDFTFVCPTEIAEFGRLEQQFADRGAQVLGVSVDSEYVHYAWRLQEHMLRRIPFPMLSDVRRDLTAKVGVLGPEGVAQRATFLVDPDGVIQFAMVTAPSVGRNVQEVLRVLDALQTEELTACSWQPGQATLDAGQLMTASS